MLQLVHFQIQNDRERLSAKPEIRTDASRYNLNFMMNNYNKNKNRKNSAKLFYNNSLNRIENSKENYSIKNSKIHFNANFNKDKEFIEINFRNIRTELQKMDKYQQIIFLLQTKIKIQIFEKMIQTQYILLL